MNTSTQKNSLIDQEILPVFLSSKTYHVQPFASSSNLEQFGIFKANFGALATSEILEQVKSHLIEIDITDEIALMHNESALEITVPILGIADLLEHLNFEGFSPHLACVLALNGYIAKNGESTNNFPRSDFIVATDIVGNKFELMVSPDGKIDFPTEGIGLFSIISSITFIYSAQQAKEGIGLESSSQVEHKSKLFMLPAMETCEPYSMTICVTQLNSLRQRVVNSIRHIHIRHQQPSFEKINTKVEITQLNKEMPDMLCIKVAISDLKRYSANIPFAINVVLQPLKGVEYCFAPQLESFKSVPSNNYIKHPIFSNVYTKYVGLSEKTLFGLIEKIYSEYDFIKDYLHGSINISHQNGYNNFLIRTEAFNALYNLLLHCLVNQKIPGKYLFERISEERLIDLELSVAKMDFHDTMVVCQLNNDFLNNYFDRFKNLFATEKNDELKNSKDSFYIHAKGLNNIIPKASSEVLAEPSFTKNILSYIDRSAFEEHFQAISSKALKQSYIEPSELEKLPFNEAKPLTENEDLLGLSTKKLHLNEVVDFSSLMTTTNQAMPAYWVELGNAYEKKGYAFYMKNIFDRKTRFNVTQTTQDKSYKISTWVENEDPSAVAKEKEAKPNFPPRKSV